MNDFLHADIFFFVTTIVVILLAIGLLVVIFYLIKILRNIYKVSDDIKEESGEMLNDIKAVRENIKEKGFTLGGIISFCKWFFGRGKSKR